jgi:hypothetical protein
MCIEETLQTSKHKKEDSDEEVEDGDLEAKLTFLSNGKMVTTLELKYTCDEHSQKQCWVMRNGTHRQLTKVNLALWALMIVHCYFCYVSMTYNRAFTATEANRSRDSALEPKARRRTTTFANEHQGGCKRNHHASRLPSKSHTGSPALHASWPLPISGSFPYYPQGFGAPEQLPAKSNEDPAVDGPTLFPFISDWLPGLDQGPRGADGHDFAQYVQYFSDNKIQRIFEIADPTLFSRDDILAICPGVKIGTANLLLKYAREDVETIRNEEQRRLREAKRVRYF